LAGFLFLGLHIFDFCYGLRAGQNGFLTTQTLPQTVVYWLFARLIIHAAIAFSAHGSTGKATVLQKRVAF
jgi:hypothetical protein